MEFRTNTTKSLVPLIVAMLAATIVAIALAACHHEKAPRPVTAPMFTRQGDTITVPADSPLRARLRVAAATAGLDGHRIALPAVVEADPARSVAVVPPLTGRLVALPVRLGDTVRQGQLLAVISAPDLAAAFADADKARDALQLAQRALQRATGVNQAGANATKDVELARSGVAQAQAEATRADARLLALNADRSGKSRLLNVTAPIAGTITAINNGAGAFLNDATATLLTITSLDHVWVTLNVPENLLSQVQTGQGADVTLAAYPGLTWHGAVASVSPLLDADTRRDKARIAFANGDGKLKPNMYGSATLTVAGTAGAPAGASQPTVPATALLMNNDSVTVFVETAPWQFVRRKVVTGAEDDGGATGAANGDDASADNPRVAIVAGLRAGERVLVSGGVLLND